MPKNHKAEKNATKLPVINPASSRSRKSTAKKLSAKGKHTQSMSVSEEVHKALALARKKSQRNNVEQREKENKSALLRLGHRQESKGSLDSFQQRKATETRTDHYIKIGTSHPVNRGK